MKAIPTWILIADGGRAYVVERKRAADGLKKVPGLTFNGPHKLSRDIGTDKPGRAFSSVGSKRAALDDDKRLAREAEEKFLGAVVDHIDESLKGGAFERLVLAAPPRVLGVLRKRLSRRLSKALYGEIRADLVKADLGQVARQLDGMKRA